MVLCVLGVSIPATGQVMPQAPAQPNEAAGRILADQAEKAVRARKYEAAIDGFRQAFEAAGDPASIYNISLLYLSRLKLPVLAYTYAIRYQELARTQADRDDATRLLAQIETALSTTHGRLVVTSTPAKVDLWTDQKSPDSHLERPDVWLPIGEHILIAEASGYESEKMPFSLKAGFKTEIILTLRQIQGQLKVESKTKDLAVSIDGVYAGSAPTEKKVNAGEHLVKAEAPGFMPFAQKVTLGPGETLVVHADLTQMPSQVVATKPIVPAAVAAPPSPPTSSRAPNHTLAWVTMAGGTAFLVTGTILYGLAYKDYQDAGDMKRSSYPTNKEFDSAFDSKIDDGKGKATASYVLWGVGGAALATGIVLYFTANSSSTALVPAGPGCPGLTAHMTW